MKPCKLQFYFLKKKVQWGLNFTMVSISRVFLSEFNELVLIVLVIQKNSCNTVY